MNQPALSPPQPNQRVRWTLGDILLVLVGSAVVAVALVLVLGLTLATTVADPQALLTENIVVLSAVSGIAIYSVLLLAIYLLIVRRRCAEWAALGFRRPPAAALLVAPVIALVQLGAAAITNLLVLQLTGQFDNPQVDSITGGQGFSWLNYGLMLLLVGIVAPIVEEVFFRGVVYGWLRSRLPLVGAVVISAAVFAAAHVIPILLPALFVIGIILALAYELSRSLWIAIILHAIQNSLTVTLIFVALAVDLPVAP